MDIYLAIYGLHGGFKTTGDFLVIPILLFGPPVALLLFGLATGWAIRVSRQKTARRANELGVVGNKNPNADIMVVKSAK